MNETKIIELHANSLDQVLTTQDRDIFPTKGVDSDAATYIYNEANIDNFRDMIVELKVFLPKHQIHSNTEELLTAICQRYFHYKTKNSQKELTIAFTRARRSLFISALFVLVSLILDYILIMMGLNETLQKLVNSIFIIAMWVAVWIPIEAFLFDWWPMGREVVVHKKLSTMKVVVLEKGS